MLQIKAKVIQADGSRVLLDVICSTRRIADDLIERAYPDHIAAILVVRRQGEGASC